MEDRKARRAEWRAAMAISLAAAALTLAPPSWTTRTRLALHGVLRPGLSLADRTAEHAVRWWTRWRRPADVHPQLVRLQSEIEDLQRERRLLQLRLATAREELALARTAGTSPWPVTSAEPLLVPELLEANVLATDPNPLWQSEAVLDAGTHAGLSGEELVIGAATVLDQGQESGLSAGGPVFAGRCVVGRLAEVGRYVSIVQPVTDADFRGHARIVRRSGDDFLFGAEGILEGTGESLCRLRHVPATEAVSVGDEVYTAGGDDPAGHPMYYGRVVAAEPAGDGQHWDIAVEPAVPEIRRRRVTVFRQTLNPLRTAAN